MGQAGLAGVIPALLSTLAHNHILGCREYEPIAIRRILLFRGTRGAIRGKILSGVPVADKGGLQAPTLPAGLRLIPGKKA